MLSRVVVSQYDEYGNPAPSVSNAATVTPSDSTALANTTSGLYIGGAGDVAVTMSSGSVVTFKAVPVGTVLKISVNKVMATNTTATNIVALY